MSTANTFRFLLLIFMVLISIGHTVCKAQLMSDKKPLLVDASVSGIGLQYDDKPIGNRLGFGFRLGVTQVLMIKNKFKLYARANYSQLGAKRFRVISTGIIDTSYVYNTIQIYEENIRLHSLNLRIGISKVIWTNGAIDVCAGLNGFGGIVLSARTKGRELQGAASYNTNSGSVYQKLNYGFEPELGTTIHLSNGKYFLLTISYEIGIPNVFRPTNIPQQGFWSTERTRAFTFTLSFPIISL